ncbi:hypothetical protein ACFX12_007855 [Malus domestica]
MVYSLVITYSFLPLPRPFTAIVKAMSSPLPSCCNELAVRRKWICKSKSPKTLFSISTRPQLSAPRFEQRRRTRAPGWRFRGGRGIVRFLRNRIPGIGFWIRGNGISQK